MTNATFARAIIAANRFGLGLAGGAPLPMADADAWLAEQLRGPDGTPMPAGLPDTAAALAALRADRVEMPPPGQHRAGAIYRAEASAAIAGALDTTTPFRERLVWFWANHFTVSIRQGGVTALAGAYLREAIRPHVTGSFADMLLAVMRHPAMLMYLDNAGSVGPDSPAGQRSHRGLNENLARECLELHTLSPEAGYRQADVTAFAAILTGWSVEMRAAPLGFRFRPFAHQPGPKTLLGRQFPEGEAGGVQALRYLAAHPATQAHLARQLARHFVADAPAPQDVAAIAGALRATDGNLGAAALAATRLKSAWQPGTKLRSAQDYAFAVLRAVDLPAEQRPPLPGTLALLGQPLWGAPLPNGWGDTAADWSAPEAMLRRIDWSYGMAGRAGSAAPMDLAQASLGPLLRPQTSQQIAHAADRRDALTLLFSAPEFQRR